MCDIILLSTFSILIFLLIIVSLIFSNFLEKNNNLDNKNLYKLKKLIIFITISHLILYIIIFKFYFILFILFVSINLLSLLILALSYKQKYKILYFESIFESFNRIKEQYTILGKLYLLIFDLFFFHIIDPINNLIYIISCFFKNLCQKKKNKIKTVCNRFIKCHECDFLNKKVNNILDIYLILLFIGLLVCYYTPCLNYSPFFLSFIIWRIIVITTRKIREIGRIDVGDIPIASFPRTIMATFINFFEIIIGFSFLYSYFNVFNDKDKFLMIIKTLLIFTSLEMPKIYYDSCPAQKWILFFQCIVFIVFVLVFIANIANLKRDNKK